MRAWAPGLAGAAPADANYGALLTELDVSTGRLFVCQFRSGLVQCMQSPSVCAVVQRHELAKCLCNDQSGGSVCAGPGWPKF